MGFPEILLIAGLCMIVGAGAFFFRMILKGAGQPGGGNDLRLMYHETGRVDLTMAILWGGALLDQVSSLLLHAGPGGQFHLSKLSLMGFGSCVFMCGLFVGRLLLRWEMRTLRKKREEKDRAAQS